MRVEPVETTTRKARSKPQRHVPGNPQTYGGDVIPFAVMGSCGGTLVVVVGSLLGRPRRIFMRLFAGVCRSGRPTCPIFISGVCAARLVVLALNQHVRTAG